jgi:protein-L-isoaspartate O-methyltransferase
VTLNIPTAVTPREAAVMVTHASGRLVLEVGALLGYSTVTLATTALHVVSVDPHDGYPAHDPRPTLSTLPRERPARARRRSTR